MAKYADILNVICYIVIHYAAALYFQLYRDCVVRQASNAALLSANQ